jgi:hypothetical protein
VRGRDRRGCAAGLGVGARDGQQAGGGAGRCRGRELRRIRRVQAAARGDAASFAGGVFPSCPVTVSGGPGVRPAPIGTPIIARANALEAGTRERPAARVPGRCSAQ